MAVTATNFTQEVERYKSSVDLEVWFSLGVLFRRRVCDLNSGVVKPKSKRCQFAFGSFALCLMLMVRLSS